MATDYLPKAITKEVLFERARERFQEWAKIYADPTKTAQWMYEDMSASCFSGCPADDFPDDVKNEQNSIIKYQYKGGMCFFMIDGIEVEVLDLRDMREDPSIEMARYSDVCIPSISYTDSDGNFIHHPIPNAWLYGSTSDEFDVGKPVHREFIDAARQYIKEHNITPELQKYLE